MAEDRDRLLEEFRRLMLDDRLADALDVAEQVATLEAQLAGENSTSVAGLWQVIAGGRLELRDFDRAIAAYRRQLEILDALSTTAEWELVDVRLNIASAQQRRAMTDAQRTDEASGRAAFARYVQAREAGDYAGAVGHAQRALELLRAALGEDHPEVLAAQSNLGLAYHHGGDYDKALATYEQAAELARRLLGDEHPQTALVLNNLAGLLVSMGAQSRALPIFEEALTVLRAAYGDMHPDVATTLNNLAGLYQSLYDFERTGPYYVEALEIRKQTLGNNDPLTAQSLNNLGAFYSETGNRERAVPLLKEALQIRRAILPANHPDVAESLNNLAAALEDSEDHDYVTSLLTEALEIHRTTLGERHPRVATSLTNLADRYRVAGEYERSLEAYQQALSIFVDALGDSHEQTAVALSNVAVAHGLLGAADKSLDYMLQSLNVSHQHVQQQAFAMSTARLRILLARMQPSLQSLCSMPLTELGREQDAVEAILNNKALAFEVRLRQQAIERLAAADPAVANLRAQLAQVRQVIEATALHAPAGAQPATVQAVAEEYESMARTIEDDLIQRLHDFAGGADKLSVSLNDIRQAIGAGGRHVEFYRYAPFRLSPPAIDPDRYMAIVLGNAPDQIDVLDLGPAAEIDGLIDQLSEHIDEFKRIAESFGDDAAYEEDYRKLAAALSARLMAPLADSLGDARHVTIGPDSRLHEVAFEALVDDAGRYLLEAGYQFAYVNSGRDLLRPHVELGEGVAVFASPDYALGYEDRLAAAQTTLAKGETLLVQSDSPPRPPEALAISAETRRGWQDLGEAGLDEGREAAAAFVEANFGPVTSFYGEQALEEVVKRLASPRVLVLVTHGDFLRNERQTATPAGSLRSFLESAADRSGAGQARTGLRSLEDPFMRSYLVLAGANQIDEPIPEGVSVENGWLTAREIAQLELNGTDLVVLSACNTNRGQSANGEAVAGMRSAFLFAGARTIVGSLFEVPNQATRELMRPFYEGVAAGEGKLAALNAAKLQFIRNRREAEGAAHPFYWASFILVGEP